LQGSGQTRHSITVLFASGAKPYSPSLSTLLPPSWNQAPLSEQKHK
jgi:hypothetical protein